MKEATSMLDLFTRSPCLSPYMVQFPDILLYQSVLCIMDGGWPHPAALLFFETPNRHSQKFVPAAALLGLQTALF